MHPLPGGRVGAWAGGACIGFVGVSGLVVGILTPEGRVLNVTVGIFLLAVAWLIVSAGALRARSSWSATTLETRPAWAMQVGGARGGPAVATAVVLSSMGIGLMLAVVSRRNPGVIVLIGPVALLLLVLAAEMWRAWLRRPQLLISADMIRFHGPGIDSEVSWDDVGTIEFLHLGTRWGAVVVLAARDAPSYRYELSRLFLPTDRAPDPPGLAVRVGLIPDAPGLVKLLRAMHIGGRSTREAMVGRGLPEDSGY